jgi:hypothetical protein
VMPMSFEHVVLAAAGRTFATETGGHIDLGQRAAATCAGPGSATG